MNAVDSDRGSAALFLPVIVLATGIPFSVLRKERYTDIIALHSLLKANERKRTESKPTANGGRTLVSDN
jgi:hypothetical protein